MNKMKKFFALSLAIIMTVSLAACGSKENNKNAASNEADSKKSETVTKEAEKKEEKTEEKKETEKKEEPVAEDKGYEDCELTFSWWGGDTRHDATLAAVDAFMKKYPGITVKSNYGAWSGWEDSMATMFATGTAPDVNQINWNWITSYSADGSTFLDLNTVADTLDLTQFSDSSKELCTVAGELQAIPVSMTGRIFYWNKTTFDKAGIATPTSYAELLAAGETFKNVLGDDYYPIALGEYDRMILMVYYLESVYNKPWVENKVLQYSVEEIQEGLDFIQKLEDSHVTPSIATITGDGADSLDKNPKWMSGTYAGIFEWDSSASKFASALSEGQELIVGEYFKDFGPYQGGYAKVSLAMAISETCKHPKEAAMLVNFLLNDNEGTAIMKSERGIPLSKAALANCSSQGLLNEMVVEANGKVLDWVQFSLDPYFEDAALKNSDGIYYDAMAGLSYDEYTLAEAAKILADGITEVMTK